MPHKEEFLTGLVSKGNAVVSNVDRANPTPRFESSSGVQYCKRAVITR